MFTKSPIDVIKGIRKSNTDKTSFLTTVFSEIQQEIKDSDLVTKTNSIKKLFILYLEGYDIEWAGFYMLEIISSLKFSQKRTGYLVVSQSLKSTSEVLILTTGLFRRDFVSKNMLETCVAVNCLASIVNEELARELLNDCITLLNTGKYVLRKKVCVLMFKMFYYWPEGLSQAIERLAEKTRDENIGVVVGTVNTIYELSRRNPRSVLFTAKQMYELLNSTSNNWLIIKLIKLFGELCKVEPRLYKKLIDPLTRILHNSSAKSVEYEITKCIFTHFSEYPKLLSLAVERLQNFLESNDPNLKFLGLSSLQQIILSETVRAEEYHSFVVESLQSKDFTIRLKALDLLKITTTKQNLPEAISHIMQETQSSQNAELKEELIGTGLFLLGKNHYELVEDFKWMFEVLCSFTKLKSQKHEAHISSIMLDSVIRVRELRAEACCLVLEILSHFEELKTERCEAITAMLFILGEFAEHMDQESIQQCFSLVSSHKWNTLLFPDTVQNALTACVFKLLRFLEDQSEAVCLLKQKTSQIDYMEAQERSLLYVNILENLTDLSTLKEVFTELLPVHPNAQLLIQPSEEINEPFEIDQTELVTQNEDGSWTYHYFREEDFHSGTLTEEQKKELRKQMKEKVKEDPFYIKSKKKGKKKKKKLPKKEEVPETLEVKELPQPSSEKKYSVNRDQPLLPK